MEQKAVPFEAPGIRLHEADEVLEGTKLPNTLKITILRAKNVAKAALRGTTSLYCKLSSSGIEYKTKVKAKTVDPVWNETFSFRATDYMTTVTVVVADKVNVKKRFVGQIRLVASDIMSEPMMRCTKWYSLVDKAWEPNDKLGEVEIKTSLVYERENDNVLHHRTAVQQDQQASSSISVGETWDASDADGFAVQQDETEEEALLRKQELELQEKQRQEAMLVNVPKGDYQIQAHIIEARDLKGENFDGTSDPICYVEVMGKKQKTSAKSQTFSCVFDEMLFFHFRNIGKKELEQANITISVYDSNLIRPNIEIGTYQFDCLSIYCRHQREVYRQWLALVDHKSKNDKGIQGFLLVSLSIVGPGESFPVHEVVKDNFIKEGTDLVLIPPTIQQKLNFLVVTVFNAEELPAMDAATFITTAGIDAFVRVDFAGNVKCKTSVITIKGSRNLSANFLEELWIPVRMPTMSRRITLSVRDREIGRSSEVVGQFTYDFYQVPALETDFSDASKAPLLHQTPLRYINIYGPPLKAKQHSKASLHMQKFPDHASTYRGRILVSLAHIKHPHPEENEKAHVKDVEIENWESLKPPTTRYVLRVALFYGQDVPLLRLRTGLSAKLYVMVSIGNYEIKFDAMTVKHGRVVWGSGLECKNIVLPSDLTQLPDVIVTLCREGTDTDDHYSIAYGRIRSSELVQGGFQRPVGWLHLLEEISRQPGLPQGQSPGSLLIRTALGREEIAARESWQSPFNAISNTLPCIIRVHIFQCRGLYSKSTTKNGLPDPFVQVHFNHIVKKTKTKRRTLDPLYYETIEIDTDVPSDIDYAPEIWIRVVSKSGYSGNQLKYVGEYRVPLAKCTKSSTVPYPSWCTLTNDTNILDDQGSTGEILMSVQYIVNPTSEERSQTIPSIVPECRQAYVDIIAMGVRGLKSNQLFHIQNPFVEFELTGAATSSKENVQKRTKASHEPESKNANFLERIVIPTKLPIDTLFSPQLVYDSTMGGLHQPLIATCVIDLTKKLPWSSNYSPPQQQEFDYHIQVEKKKSNHPEEKDNKDEAEEQASESGESDVQVDDDDMGSSSGYSSENDKLDTKENELSPAERDDGTGIGILPLPTVSYEPATTDDPAVQKQLKAEEERRLFASVEDAKKKGRVYIVPGSDTNVDEANTAGKKGYDTPAYYAGRDWWINSGGKELEEFLKTKPFESYPLFRAHTIVTSLFRRRKQRIQVQTGVFKGIVVVTLEAQKQNPLVDFTSLSEPKLYEIRVYVLRATNLQPKDRNGLSDPYLKLQLGKIKINDRPNYIKKTLNPDFYRAFTLEATIPGTSQLSISVWDYDRIGTDDFIGETIIDLEDRWFHKQWQDIGHGHPKLKSAGTLKPIEYRPLWTGKESTSQGTLQLWVDILTPPQAALYEPIDIAPPPSKKFEVRVVIWKSEGVIDKELSETNDLFVKAWIEGQKAQSTDIHWRCSTGKASWNYRMKFQIQMPMKPEFARLHIQLWEKDLLKWQDIIGGTELDLYRWFQIAYYENRTVMPFKEMKHASRILDGEINDEEEEEEESDEEDGRVVDLEKNEAKVPLLKEKSKPPTKLDKLKSVMPRRNKVPNKTKTQKSGEKSSANNAQLKAAKKAAKEQNEAKEAIGSFMDFIGLGRLPDDSEWLTMRFNNREEGISEEMGKIAVGIHIVTEAEFTATPVGNGRDEPNINPYLPPTVGRIKLSANPFSLMREIVGPKMCARIACFLCCMGCLSFMALFGASIMSALTFYEQMQARAEAAEERHP
ncbi:dysferlin [Thraustotheca clavata]|uniref:Dysferlin n=1 Tax=Thraustotheca clavata TaxID=74557 RepID=A0A1W0A6V4_9STRA|nr:dysferlin [Thraustotheca clavata]